LIKINARESHRENKSGGRLEPKRLDASRQKIM
jgi:hypothetical protein